MDHPAAGSEAQLEKAIHALRQAECVVIPTETVYGLAGDALNPAAIRRIFEIKGRPADHPLIAHVSSLDMALSIAEAKRFAMQLAAAFWPGPLTLILPRKPHVPPEVSGGRDSVGVRVPRHPLTLKLIGGFGKPLAAPSANRFTRLSPTKANDVDPEIRRQAAAVLDGGTCLVGIESTVLDLTSDIPAILRAGDISAEDIAEVIGVTPLTNGDKTKAPGSHPVHYQPKAKLILVDSLDSDQAGLSFAAVRDQIQMPDDPKAYAQELYAALHQLDRAGHAMTYVQKPPKAPGWEAVWDRLNRAQSGGGE